MRRPPLLPLLLLLLTSLWAFSARAQTSGAPLTAYWVLKEITCLWDGSETTCEDNVDPSNGNLWGISSLSRKFMNFYEAALIYGQVPMDDFDQYLLAGADGSFVTGDIQSFAREWQCSEDPMAPGEVINGHFVNNPRRFTTPAGTSSSYPYALWFLHPVDVRRDPDGLTMWIDVELIWYTHPEKLGWIQLAGTDAPKFRADYDAFLRTPLNIGSGFVTSAPGGTFGRAGTGVYSFRVHVVDDGGSCFWDPDSEQWVKSFADGSYYLDGNPYTGDPAHIPEDNWDNIADPEPGTPGTDGGGSPNPNGGGTVEQGPDDWMERDHDGDGVRNVDDPDYDPYGDHDDDGVQNRYDPDYDPPVGAEPPGGGDFAPPPDLCVPTGGVNEDGTPECRDLTELPSPDYADLAYRFSAVFQQFVDTSALVAQGAEPTFEVPGFSSQVFSWDGAELTIPSTLLSVLGWALVATASLSAIRMTFT